MPAIAAAPLVAAGPPGWVILGILGVAVVAITAVAIMDASNKADESFKESDSDLEECPNKSQAGSGCEPKDYPENPDDLKEQGYEETTHPEAQKYGVRRFKNPKTGDEVEFHKGKDGKPGWEGQDHWHRFNPKGTGKGDAMLDEKGNAVPKGSNPSHLTPK